MPRRPLTASMRDRRRVLNAEFMRNQRQNPEYRTLDQQRNNEQHQRARQNTELRAIEQQRDAQAHRDRARTARLNHPGYKVALNSEGYVEEHYLGRMDVSCSECKALHFTSEKRGNSVGYGLCCSHGKVKLNQLRSSEVIENLLTSNRNYRENIRSYNSALAMASTVAKVEEPLPYGPKYFKIHDQIYHNIGSLYPGEGRRPCYAQLYTYEVGKATSERMKIPANENCDPAVMHELGQHLSEINPYAVSFKRMHESIQSEPHQLEHVRMEIIVTKENDPRRYNAPTANDVACIFRAEEGQPIGERNLVIYPREGQLRTINIHNPLLDPLAYPLLFPYGEQGWHIGLRHDPARATRTKNKVSIMDYAKYRLGIREGFSLLHQSESLSLQYWTDLYSRMEENNLQFQRNNQEKLRMELNQNLMDHLTTRAEATNMRIGKPVLLASTFKGSPRNMLENYNDAMAIVRSQGKPDLFITMTCNPEWKEITESLPRTQKWNARPDIVDRVFREKVASFIQEIKKDRIFGNVAAVVYTIEFQKRGLPHVHILVSLEGSDKLSNSEHVDSVVCAELPDPKTDPELFEIIKKNNIHGPCIGSNSVCQQGNGKCSKKFPKPFTDITRDCNKGFPKYRRRQGISIPSNTNVPIDNSWVVPYNRYLSLRYKSHINVEVCASVKGVKYIYKYVYKGHDSCIVIFSTSSNQSIEIVYDEIKSYLAARYVTSHEAIWRLYGFETDYQSMTVVRLACHLPNQQAVFFREGGEEEAALAENRTTLTEWFKANSYPESISRDILYTDMPQHYTWTRKKEWKPRQRGGDGVVTRMYIVSPKNVELFHLRLLLLHVRGSTSFIDLRTFENVTYDTFRQAAIARGIAENNDYFTEIMTEAIQVKTSTKQLRELFAVSLALNVPGSAVELWEQFKDDLIDDFLHTMSETESYNRALIAIQEILVTHGTSCELLNLPSPNYDILMDTDDFLFDYANRFDELYAQANPQQKEIIDEITKSLEINTPKVIMVDAPGGCGKTFTELCIIEWCRRNHVSVLPTAHSGIAASLMPDGRTIHNQYKLPLKLTESSRSDISAGTAHAQKVQSARLLIFDECSAIPRLSMTVVDRLLRDLDTTSEEPYAGKTVMFCGDFRQTLPVVPHGGRAETVDMCIKSGALWNNVQVKHLTTNMRVNEGEEEFSEFLLKVGNATLPVVSDKDYVELPAQLTGEGSPMDFVFDRESLETSENITERAILAPTNEDCDVINSAVLEMLPGESRTYLSFDSEVRNDPNQQLQYPTEFLNTIEASGLPRHSLTLKRGAIVMLIRNLNSGKGLINGTRMRVEKMCEHLLDCTILTGASCGERILLPRIKLCPSDTSIPIDFSRTQFPIILAFCLTINKAQGQSLSRIALYLPRPVFSHGQLYVALSRCRSFAGVKIFIKNQEGQYITDSGCIVTRNVVYKEVL